MNIFRTGFNPNRFFQKIQNILSLSPIFYILTHRLFYIFDRVQFKTEKSFVVTEEGVGKEKGNRFRCRIKIHKRLLYAIIFEIEDNTMPFDKNSKLQIIYIIFVLVFVTLFINSLIFFFNLSYKIPPPMLLLFFNAALFDIIVGIILFLMFYQQKINRLNSSDMEKTFFKTKRVFLIIFIILLLTSFCMLKYFEYWMKSPEGLIWAVKNNRVDLIYANKVNVNATDRWGVTALMCAAENGETDIVNELLYSKPDINVWAGNMSALSLAARGGYSDIVQSLLEHGADINATVENRMTALMWAVRSGNKLTVQVLLNHGADINIKNHNGQTALKLAELLNKKDIAELLKKAGAKE